VKLVDKKTIASYYEREGKRLTTNDIDKSYRGYYRYFSTHGSRRVILERWLKKAKKNETFLDVGCELGYFVRKMAQQGLNAVGIDISPTKIQKADYIAQKMNINCQFKVMDAEHLQFEDNSFDWVLCSETLEHVLNDRQAANELVRVAKGYIIVTVPQKSLFWRVLNRIRPVYHFATCNAGHLRDYTPETLLNLFPKQVRVESMKSCNFFAAILDRFLSRISILKAILCIKLKKISK